jgi:hypothetical protein
MLLHPAEKPDITTTLISMHIINVYLHGMTQRWYHIQEKHFPNV